MPAANGFNATISSRGASGSRRVRVMAIDYPLDINTSADNESGTRRSFYPISTDGSNFSITLGFVSWEEREDFNKWMTSFMSSVVAGTTNYGTMTVRAPSRKFTRVGVPQGPLQFGEGIMDVAYFVQVAFVGSHDPVDPDLSQKMQGVSYFNGPGKFAISRFFYPAGQQAKGAEALDQSLFDQSPVTTDPAANTTADGLTVGPGGRF